MAYYSVSSSSSSSYDEQQIMRRQQKERNDDVEMCGNGSNNLSAKNRKRCCGIDIDIDDTDTSITKMPLLMMLILFLLMLVATSIAIVDPRVKIRRYHQHPQQQQQQQDRDGDTRFFFREGKTRMTVLPTTSSSTTTAAAAAAAAKTATTSSLSSSKREDDEKYTNSMWRRNLVEKNQEQEEITADVDADTKNETTTTSTIAPTTIVIQKPLFISVSGIVLGFISTAFVIGSWIFVCCYRNNPIVSLGQPPFLYLICFGSLLMSLSLFAEGGIAKYDEQFPQYALNDMCIVIMWFQDLGIIIVYMSLFCKLWRAEQVTQFRRGNTVLVHHVIGPLFVILIIQIGILIGHTIVTPPYWADAPFNPYDSDDPLRIETCYQFNPDDPIDKIFNASTLILLAVCEIITMWMACKTKNIREDISDSWRVFQTMCFQFILTILSVLVNHGVIPVRKLYYLIIMGYPFLMAMSSTGFIIIPKMYFVWYKKRYGQLPDNVQSPIGIGRVVVNVSYRPSGGTGITTDNSNATRSSNSNNNTERITASKSTMITTDIPPFPSRTNTNTISFLDENQSTKSNSSESSLPDPIQEEEDKEQP